MLFQPSSNMPIWIQFSADELLYTHSRSNIVPSGVHTGCSKGCRVSAQRSKGNCLNGRAIFREPAPDEAPCWPTVPDHSEWLMR